MLPGSRKHFDSFIEIEKVLCPFLHIKLGFVKQYVKSMSLDGLFPPISFREDLKIIAFEKIKHRLFVKLDICKPFSRSTTVENLLDNNKSPNYSAVIQTMLLKYRKLESIIKVKVHFLLSYLQCFPENFRDLRNTVKGLIRSSMRWDEGRM